MYLWSWFLYDLNMKFFFQLAGWTPPQMCNPTPNSETLGWWSANVASTKWASWWSPAKFISSHHVPINPTSNQITIDIANINIHRNIYISLYIYIIIYIYRYVSLYISPISSTDLSDSSRNIQHFTTPISPRKKNENVRRPWSNRSDEWKLVSLHSAGGSPARTPRTSALAGCGPLGPDQMGGGLISHPSEKWWTSSIGMMNATQYEWEHQKWQPNHQPVYMDVSVSS